MKTNTLSKPRLKEGRIVTAAKVKKSLQMYKVASNQMEIVTSYVNLRGRLQIGQDEISRIAKLFNLEIQKTNVDEDSWHGSIYLEGLELFSFKFNFDGHKDLRYRETKKMYKDAFLDSDGDKQRAFEIMKQRDRFERLKNYKSISDIEKFWIRKEKLSPIESVMQKYLAYRSNWSEKERDEDGYRAEDFYNPFTFKQWYTKNY